MPRSGKRKERKQEKNGGGQKSASFHHGARLSNDEDSLLSLNIQQLVETPSPAYHLQTKHRVEQVSSSIADANKRQRLASDASITADMGAPTTAKRKSSGLGAIGQAFMKRIMSSRSHEIDLKEYSQTMNVPIRRLYDVINILGGAGAVECIPSETTRRTRYRWIASGLLSQPTDDNHECTRRLKEEEDKLDSWMNTLQQENQEHHVTSHDLMKLFGQDTTLLAIVNTSMTHVTEYQRDTRHSLALQVPPPRYDDKDQEILPEAFLCDDNSSVQLVTFPSIYYPSNQENVVVPVPSVTPSPMEEDTVRDYSPLKKLLAAISTDMNSGSSITAASDGVSVSRHPFETLLEASTVRGSSGAQTTSL